MKSSVIELLREEEIIKALFFCEGCNSYHAPIIKRIEEGPLWSFNNDLENPSFRPSILVTFEYSSKENNKKYQEFKKDYGRYPTLEELPYDKKEICHSYITNGEIKYLNDCTHHLKGKTVKLKPIK